MAPRPRSTPGAALPAIALALLVAGCPGFRTGYSDVPALDAVVEASLDLGAPDAAEAGIDASMLDAQPVDAPTVDVPPVDVPAVDVPAVDVPAVDVPAVDVPPIDVPTPIDVPVVVDGGEPTPRPVGPSVGAIVTYPRPSLHWRLSGPLVGAAVQVCRDRACATVEASFDATGTSGTLPSDLPTGPHFWRLRGITASGRLASSSPTWEFWVSPLRPPRESAYGAVLDFDGDGNADLAVGAPGTAPGAGRVLVWRGPLTTAAMPLTLTGLDPSAVGFGRVVTCVGDVDGDGLTDLGVTSYDPGATQGQLEIFRGNVGFSQVRGRRLTTPGGLTFAASADGAGDTNGDGYADVIVGQPEAADGHGRAYVHFGSAEGVHTSSDVTLLGRDLAGARFGYAVAGGADFDADGFADVIVGGPGAPVGQGGAYVYLGGSAGTNPLTRNILATDGDPDGRYGAVVAHLGDINDDGFSDLAVGSPGDGTRGGRVMVFLGSGVGVSPSPAAMLPAPAIPTEFFGVAIAGLGDVDDDGFGDFGVGATAAGIGGRVTVVHGAATVTRDLRRAIVSGLTAGGEFGASLGSVDPVSDTFVVGAPAATSAGRYVPMGAAPSSPAFVFAPTGLPDFGRSVTGVW